MRFLLPVRFALVLALLLTSGASAQETDSGEPIRSNIALGLRAGYTDWAGRNQLHLGAHLKLEEVLPNIQVTPGVEAGFGDGATLITVNGDVTYSFSEFFEHPWHLTGGASLGLIYVNPDDAGSATDLGLSALVGIERSFANEHRGLVELRFGLIDSPDFKLTFGYTFF